MPIPTHLLDMAHTPSLYKVAASVHVSLGATVEPQAAASADAKSLVGGGRGPAGMLRGLRAVRDKDRASLGAFRFFGNTMSSARVDLRRAKGEEAGCSRSGGDGAGAGEIGCGGAIGGVARAGNVGRGRDTTNCRVDFESACELCLHSRQPLKNLNIVAELVVTVTNAQNDVDLSHESICWTIVPLTYACRVWTYASSSPPVTPHTPRKTGSILTRSCGLARASKSRAAKAPDASLRVSQFPVAAGNDPASSSAKSSLLPRVCGLASPVALARNGHQDSEQKGSDSRRSPSRVHAPSRSLSHVPCSLSGTHAQTISERSS